MMIQVRAILKLYIGPGKRKTPFTDGYRPLFDFAEKRKVSGMIKLLDRTEFRPGEEALVEIRFLADDQCIEGEQFRIYEAVEPLGEGNIIEILPDGR